MLQINVIILLLLLIIFPTTSGKIVDAPVIAILANPHPYNAEDITSSKLNSQYVRWLEQSYAEIVVIQPWQTEQEIDEILEKVNGVLWPGGDRDLKLCGQFEITATYILKKIIKLYEEKNVKLPL